MRDGSDADLRDRAAKCRISSHAGCGEPGTAREMRRKRPIRDAWRVGKLSIL